MSGAFLPRANRDRSAPRHPGQRHEIATAAPDFAARTRGITSPSMRRSSGLREQPVRSGVQREARVRTLRRLLPIALVAALGFTAVPAPAQADPIADFYAGKTVQLIIGYAPGAGYDEYARLLGRHIGRHIPGNPTVVVQNMPGAGSIRAANYLFNVAPKDGTTIGGFARGLFLDPLLGR